MASVVEGFETAHATYGMLDEENNAGLAGLEKTQVAALRSALRELLPLSSKDNVRAHALAQQATVGPCRQPDPGRFDGRHELWVAWKGLGDMDRTRAAEEYVRIITGAVVNSAKVKEVFAKLGRGPVHDHLVGPFNKLEQLARSADLGVSAYEVVNLPSEDTGSRSEPRLRPLNIREATAAGSNVPEQIEAIFDSVLAPDTPSVSLAPPPERSGHRLSPSFSSSSTVDPTPSVVNGAGVSDPAGVIARLDVLEHRVDKLVRRQQSLSRYVVGKTDTLTAFLAWHLGPNAAYAVVGVLPFTGIPCPQILNLLLAPLIAVAVVGLVSRAKWVR